MLLRCMTGLWPPSMWKMRRWQSGCELICSWWWWLEERKKRRCSERTYPTASTLPPTASFGPRRLFPRPLSLIPPTSSVPFLPTLSLSQPTYLNLRIHSSSEFCPIVCLFDLSSRRKRDKSSAMQPLNVAPNPPPRRLPPIRVGSVTAGRRERCS